MGEYYNWVNVDEREYICPADFDYGNKFHETMNKDSTPLLALHTLLSGEWKGDRIVWFGDETSVSAQSPYSVIRTLYEQSVDYGNPGDAFDMICESYRNVSCLFAEAETRVREEIGYYLQEYQEKGRCEHYNEYGIDVEQPFKGLFEKTGKRFLYTINHTKKLYYSLDEWIYIDPLPSLMAYGHVKELGEWLGDVIGVSDRRPEGYSLLDGLNNDW